MTAANFQKCLQLVLVSEGGNVDDPDDPGGRTSRGITQREYDAFCKTHPGLPSDVFSAPQSAVSDIYDISYWQPFCPQCPDGVDYVFFDSSVLNGPGRAAKWLQQAVGVDPDGHIGVITLTALKSANPKDVVVKMSGFRADNYNELVAANPKLKKFLKGWLSRTTRVQTDALGMTAAAPAVA
jgi:lysozyme family protein